MSQEGFEEVFYGAVRYDEAERENPMGDLFGGEPTRWDRPQARYHFEELRKALPDVSDEALATLAAAELVAQSTIYAAKASFYAVRAAAFVQFDNHLDDLRGGESR